jgi:hypothetical protein
MELVILGLTKRLVVAAATVADTADFLGSWDLGIAVIGLGGLWSSRTWPPVGPGKRHPTPRASTGRLPGLPASSLPSSPTRSLRNSPVG